MEPKEEGVWPEQMDCVPEITPPLSPAETVMVTVAVPLQPAALVPVTVYVAVEDGVAVTVAPEVALRPAEGLHA